MSAGGKRAATSAARRKKLGREKRRRDVPGSIRSLVAEYVAAIQAPERAGQEARAQLEAIQARGKQEAEEARTRAGLPDEDGFITVVRRRTKAASLMMVDSKTGRPPRTEKVGKAAAGPAFYAARVGRGRLQPVQAAMHKRDATRRRTARLDNGRTFNPH